MNFIETLKSVGGVKPCPNRKKAEGVLYEGPADFSCSCPKCHGTGQILDLNLLLAKPKELELVLREHLTFLRMTDAHVAMPSDTGTLYVIGPQRAHSLVYEVARQLGGTAVVAEPVQTIVETRAELLDGKRIIGVEKGPTIIQKEGYRLSLLIPPDATVLFVTDRVDEKELSAVMEATMTSAPKNKPHEFLPYVLALVSDRDEWEFPDPEKTKWKVISLHKET
jgi:hypothetical protein